MKILIFGASNVIAIVSARVLADGGHDVVMSDTNAYARAFYSRYCRRKYIFPDRALNEDAFAVSLAECLDAEGIDLIVPTTNRALMDLAAIRTRLPSRVNLPASVDVNKLDYVLDKRNLPDICREAGVMTPVTVAVNDQLLAGANPALQAPVVIKRATGVAGDGFVKVERLEMLGGILKKSMQSYSKNDLLVQEFIDGKVYGAGGVFDGTQARGFYAYEYVKRYPRACGSPTLCLYQGPSALAESWEKVLTALQWRGYCQMDFIIDSRDKQPYLLDINPVHWYTMPFSSALGLNNLDCFLAKGDHSSNKLPPVSPYTTVCLTRELQRILAFEWTNECRADVWKSYFRWFRGLRKADFYWDPFPVVLAMPLKILRLLAAKW